MKRGPFRFIFPIFLLFCLFSCGGGGKDLEKELCQLELGPCVKFINSTRVSFSAEPIPISAFKETIFIIEVMGKSKGLPPQLTIELTMPGMYMGENRVNLKKESSKDQITRYRGRGIIPRCPSGKTLWQAELDLPETGKFVFRFHVKN